MTAAIRCRSMELRGAQIELSGCRSVPIVGSVRRFEVVSTPTKMRPAMKTFGVLVKVLAVSVSTADVKVSGDIIRRVRARGSSA